MSDERYHSPLGTKEKILLAPIFAIIAISEGVHSLGRKIKKALKGGKGK